MDVSDNDNVHIISDDDDVVLPLSIKKTNQEEIVKNEKMELMMKCPIRFSHNRNKTAIQFKYTHGNSILMKTTDEDIDFEGCLTEVVQSLVTMSSATSDVTYTSVYTDSEPAGFSGETMMRI
ncbi:hypothetical protein Tco_0077568 [Tanacetum coccineum]